MGSRVFLPLKSASFSTSSPRSPVTVRDCFTFRFVSLREGGQIVSMLGAKKKKWRRRKRGRKAEVDDDKNEEEKEKFMGVNNAKLKWAP